MWLDHRAISQAGAINQTDHYVLKYVGGLLSPEQQAAKMLWLKENLNETWKKAAKFLDLPEYLTYRATGSFQRSMCSVVSKFNFMGDESQRDKGSSSGWIDSYWKAIGLQDLVEEGYTKLGSDFTHPGSVLNQGLSHDAAEEMGLLAGLPVGCSMIDAYAGGLGVIGADISGHSLPCKNQPITSCLALVCGTSTCHIALSEEALFVKGVWGPYFSNMVPGFWLNEGGQTATGKLIDHMIETHPSYDKLKEKAETSGISVYDLLNQQAEKLASERGLSSPAFLTCHFHMLPDFHGNRSPIADADMRGMVCGLNLSTSLDDLAIKYLASIQALAHGTRHIIDSMNVSGHHVSTLFMCGGLTKNTLYVQVHADITGMPCVLPREEDSVLVGSGILGACAARDFSSLQEAMKAMTAVGSIVRPDPRLQKFYEKKHKVFLKMQRDQLEYRQMMVDT
ncbi:FGGY carbohydrate kinase domain-containing protein [Nematostella vectensis]|uniref:FGGY carbohydrate kinase domain-containing protein n=1 Tax=Nematostella vectensis TaxID=45351 RepID=UPI0020774718|nr:FGGY carbohydrate kinase domain-containing protein [Nematostella vectensis]